MSLDIRARVRTFDKISRVIQSSPPRNTWPIRPFSPKLWIHGVSQKQKNELPQWLSTKCGSSYNVHRSHRRSLGHNFPICPAAIAGAFFVNFARLFVLVSIILLNHHAPRNMTKPQFTTFCETNGETEAFFYAENKQMLNFNLCQRKKKLLFNVAYECEWSLLLMCDGDKTAHV